MTVPPVESTLRVLQVVALTLPAIALYLSVLAELHMGVKRTAMPANEKILNNTSQNPDPGELYDFKIITITKAHHARDFALGVASFAVLLLAGIVLLLSTVVDIPEVRFAGVVLTAVSFLVFALAVIATLIFVIQEYREEHSN